MAGGTAVHPEDEGVDETQALHMPSPQPGEAQLGRKESERTRPPELTMPQQPGAAAAAGKGGGKSPVRMRALSAERLSCPRAARACLVYCVCLLSATRPPHSVAAAALTITRRAFSLVLR